MEKVNMWLLNKYEIYRDTKTHIKTMLRDTQNFQNNSQKFGKISFKIKFLRDYLNELNLYKKGKKLKFP